MGCGMTYFFPSLMSCATIDSGWKKAVADAGLVSTDAHRPVMSQVVACVHPLEQSMHGVCP